MTTTPPDEMTFEEAYAELEEVITQLESGDLSLDASVSLYERGQQLSAYCQQLLDTAELRVQRLHDNGTLSDED